jgi:hypothetical protein
MFEDKATVISDSSSKPLKLNDVHTKRQEQLAVGSEKQKAGC